MWTVTRQAYYYSGEYIVEIASGGIDYSGSDALAKQYPGEFETFNDPREAVETAIRICNLWRKDKPERFPRIGHGSTGGMGMEIEATTYKEARQWAGEVWEAMPKCPNCGDPMPDDKREFWRANDWSGEEFCSENCATRAMEWEEEQEAELESE